MSKKNQILSIEQQAGLFTQLAQLESSGLPAFQAFAILTESEVKLKKPLTLMQQYLKAGLPISEAGFKAGIFDGTHKSLIHAAEAGGQLATVYRQLANHYTRHNVRIKKVKSRLYLPLLILTLSLFIEPLPGFISGELTVFAYLQMSLGRLFVMGLGVFLLLRIPDIADSLGMGKDWHRLQLRIPAAANWIIKRQINEFLFILALMLESGMAFADALPKAVAAIKNSLLREKFAPSIMIAASGASAAETLAKGSVINPMILHIVNNSEQSGKLAGGLLQFTKIEAETIALHDDALTEWLPRLLYSLIAVWMAYSILGSQLATVPPNF